MSDLSLLMWPALIVIILALPVGRRLLRGTLDFLEDVWKIHVLFGGGDGDDDG